jgi:hypothetical protein
MSKSTKEEIFKLMKSNKNFSKINKMPKLQNTKKMNRRCN